MQLLTPIVPPYMLWIIFEMPRLIPLTSMKYLHPMHLKIKQWAYCEI